MRSCRPYGHKGKAETPDLTKTAITGQVDSRGSRGDTQRKPFEVARETLTDVPIGTATDGYKETKFHRVCKGVGVAHSTDSISRTTEP